MSNSDGLTVTSPSLCLTVAGPPRAFPPARPVDGNPGLMSPPPQPSVAFQRVENPGGE
jgi:hypothetical protein